MRKIVAFCAKKINAVTFEWCSGEFVLYLCKFYRLYIRNGQIVKVEEVERYSKCGSASLKLGFGQSPQRGPVAEPLVIAPLKLKTILLLDTRQTCRACRFFSISQRSVWFS